MSAEPFTVDELLVMLDRCKKANPRKITLLIAYDNLEEAIGQLLRCERAELPIEQLRPNRIHTPAFKRI